MRWLAVGIALLTLLVRPAVAADQSPAIFDLFSPAPAKVAKSKSGRKVKKTRNRVKGKKSQKVNSANKRRQNRRAANKKAAQRKSTTPPLPIRKPNPPLLAALTPTPPKPIAKKPAAIAAKSPLWRWTITRDRWTLDDERGFEEFVRLIGESDCDSIHACLTSPTANPRFHTQNPAKMKFVADCADLPFVLRGYFAWQSGLPFSYSAGISEHPAPSGYDATKRGKKIIARRDIVGPTRDARQVLTAIRNSVSTGHFRVPAAYKGKYLADHYPVKITRQSIKSGTVIFDPGGHVAVVYKVTDDGHIHYVDANPANSMSRGIYSRKFGRAEPTMGAGFKRWRPQRLEGSRKKSNGTLSGGKIVLAKDSELTDWSDEQFFGNVGPRSKQWRDGRFELNNETLDFHHFTRLRLAPPGYKFDPVNELRTMMRELCNDLGYRAKAVDQAIADGIDKRPQPQRLPNNIYATDGDWEVYATPARDARLKSSFKHLREETIHFLTLAKSGSSILSYDGDDLRSDLLAVYQTESQSCHVTYTKSDGVKKKLGFEEVRRRLFQLSFDPYHCVERRWGADDAQELKTCKDGPVKRAWYVAEERLRNQTVRTFGERMDWNLAQLKRGDKKIGRDRPSYVELVKFLRPGGPVNAEAPAPNL